MTGEWLKTVCRTELDVVERQQARKCAVYAELEKRCNVLDIDVAPTRRQPFSRMTPNYEPNDPAGFISTNVLFRALCLD
jgi:hypothetical protein